AVIRLEPAPFNSMELSVESSGIQRRWTRWAIVLLVAVNAALWASFVWSAGTSGVPRGRPHAGAAPASRSTATPGR
ncbi:MAG TPA: hypothetical protein VLU06_01400, partial [Thermoanaerobaculia bacterium]|nr:hypothetical protein [Thermoanaerobaculia bacterium]